MSWEQVTAWNWFCDGCPTSLTAYDDAQPAGWLHTQDGRDLCAGCA